MVHHKQSLTKKIQVRQLRFAYRSTQAAMATIHLEIAQFGQRFGEGCTRVHTDESNDGSEPVVAYSVGDCICVFSVRGEGKDTIYAVFHLSSWPGKHKPGCAAPNTLCSV
jgi:hypothetical protein